MSFRTLVRALREHFELQKVWEVCESVRKSRFAGGWVCGSWPADT